VCHCICVCRCPDTVTAHERIQYLSAIERFTTLFDQDMRIEVCVCVCVSQCACVCV